MTPQSKNNRSTCNKAGIKLEDLYSVVNNAIPGFNDLFTGKCETDTKEKAELLGILRVAMGSTPEKARKFINIIDQVIQEEKLTLLNSLLKFDDLEEGIHISIKKVKNLPKSHNIIPSTTATKKAESKISEKENISFQLNMIRQYLQILKDKNCLSAEVNIAVDPTHYRKATKRLPRHTRIIIKGQSPTKHKGLYVNDIYDTTHGINLMSFFEMNHKTGLKRKAMPSWITIFIQILAIYSEFNIKIVNILADRGFASGYEYGAFSCGKIFNDFGDILPVRLVEPTKFYSNNPKKSFEPLDVKDWEIDKIKVYDSDIRSRKPLMKYLGAYYFVTRHGNIHVPVIRFAFLETENNFIPISQSNFHYKMQTFIDKNQSLKSEIDSNYNRYQILVKQTNLNERTQKKWLNKRKNNKQYQDESTQMYELWLHSFKMKEKIEASQERMFKMRKKLRFYTVSITAEEEQILTNGHKSTKKALINQINLACYEYHQRWMIENYFAILKREILHINKTCSINWMRQQSLQAQLIYNGYILARTITIAAEKRKNAPRWRPEESKFKTRRKPLRSKDYRLMSFNQFIGDIASKCLKIRLKKVYV